MKKIVSFFLAVSVLCMMVGIFTGYKVAQKKNEKEMAEVHSTEVSPVETGLTAENEPVTNSEEKEKAETVLEKMTLEEKLFQMLFVTPESITGTGQVIAAGAATEEALQKYPVGGIIYFSQNLQSRKQTAEMIENSQSFSKIPLFIGVDEEGGRVARLGKNPEMGVTKFPSMREIGDAGDSEKAFEVGQTLGKELKALGFTVDFAPVADVIIASSNTEIGDRSFGMDADLVSEMVAQLTKGLQAENVSATLKHFPGHGSTVTDSHTGYSESRRTLEELRNTEFKPFAKGIEAGADFVMVSHMTPIHIDDVPASLSKTVITTLLREELGFDGIVITDAFNMGAITERYSPKQAITMAVQAGADMILMPTDVGRAHAALLEAVQNGEITEERIDESVLRILQIKENRGLL